MRSALFTPVVHFTPSSRRRPRVRSAVSLAAVAGTQDPDCTERTAGPTSSVVEAIERQSGYNVRGDLTDWMIVSANTTRLHARHLLTGTIRLLSISFQLSAIGSE